VLLGNGAIAQRRLVPEGFLCHVCRLYIDPSERYLANTSCQFRHRIPLPSNVHAEHSEAPPRIEERDPLHKSGDLF
jgi:hypothetical protein